MSHTQTASKEASPFPQVQNFVGAKQSDVEPAPAKEMSRRTYKGGGGLVKQQQKLVSFPMKVQNMNAMVQLRKKRPRMTFSDKQAFDSEKERLAAGLQAHARAQVSF